MQAPPPPGLAQARAACPVPFLTQGHPQPTGTIAAFVKAKDLDQGGFPGRCFLCHRPLLALVPGVKAAGRHAQRLAEPPHGVVAALGGDEAAAAHWSGVCEITRLKRLLAMAFFKLLSSGAGRRARARSWRSSAAVAGSSAASNGAATGVWTAFGRRLGGFLPLVEALRAGVQRPSRGLGRAAWLGQAQGFSAEGGIIFAAFVRFWRVFHDEGKIPPCSVQPS